MNELMEFAFEKKSCRTITLENRPWWVGKDVCDILGFKNHNNAMKHHCKGVTKFYPLLTAGGMQNVRIINEPDLYRLVGHSTLPQAQKFERWIYEEVIPSIMRTGSYGPHVPQLDADKLVQTIADTVKTVVEKAQKKMPKHAQYAFFNRADSAECLQHMKDALDKGMITVSEWRSIVLGKNARLVTYDSEIAKFISSTLAVTGFSSDFIFIKELYQLYVDTIPHPMSRNIFVRFIKKNIPRYHVQAKESKRLSGADF